jgi:putative peptidoglycan lipid II flippase
MRRIGAAAALMMTAVFLSRIIGYLRDAFIAARFGASSLTDAYYAAFTIPDFLNMLVAGGTLSITFLPIYARYLARDAADEANHVLSIAMTFSLLLVGGGVVLAEALAGPILGAYLHKLDADALAACVRMTRILLPAQVFFFAGALFSATLYARGRFAAAALAPLLYNVGIIAGGAALGALVAQEGLAWGALAGAVAGPFLVPAISAIRHGARVRPSLNLRHPGAWEWLKLTLPLYIGVSIVFADDWIMRYFAGADAGAITRLSFAKRLVAVPVAVAGQAVGQASMPFFARLFAEGKRDELADTVARTLRGGGIVASLVAAWMIALAGPLVDLLFRRGKFGAAEIPATAMFTAIFAAAVPLWSLQGLLARLFYAGGDTWKPMLSGTAVTLVSIPAYAGLYRLLGDAGLAVGSGLAILGHTAALVVLAPRFLVEMRGRLGGVARALAAGVVLAALAGGAAFGAAALMPGGGYRGDLYAIAAGSAAFLAVTWLVAPHVGVDEPQRLARRAIDKLRRRA